jgi:hypothetical protein
VAKFGTSKAGGTISQQAAVHPWFAADAHGNKQTNSKQNKFRSKLVNTHANKLIKGSILPDGNLRSFTKDYPGSKTAGACS